MAIVQTADNLPGIVGLLEQYKLPGFQLRRLAHQLLVEGSPLSRYERELIATAVSTFNTCEFCARSHAAVVVALAPEKGLTIGKVFEMLFTGLGLPTPPSDAAITVREYHLINLAVQVADNKVIERPSGFTDEEIHDAALIASSFCMFNRYVHSLDTSNCPDDMHLAQGKRIAQNGYI